MHEYGSSREAIAVRGVQHVALPMPPDGIDAVRAFYCGLLGLRERTPVANTSRRPLHWLDAGATEIHFVVEGEASELNPRSRRHVCFQVDDVDALRRHLEAAGVETEDQDFDIPSRPRFFARDPFGNRIEFLSLVGEEA